jgi:NCS1 family nucleobase:cation symporter-1
VITYFLGGLGALLGPLFGVMIVDYYVLRRQRVNIEHLYTPNSGSSYFYWKGINPVALAAFIPAAIVAMIVAFLPALSVASPFAWFVGVAIAGGLYFWLGRRRVLESTASSME